MSQKETALSRRIKEILKELQPFIKLKVVEAYGVAGAGFAAGWNVKLEKPISIKQAYALKPIKYMRGFTITLENETVIKTRLDISASIQVFTPEDKVYVDGMFVKIKEKKHEN